MNGARRPTIVCLCGSTRFYAAFQRANYDETMAGRIVLSIGFYPGAGEGEHGEHVGITSEQKTVLDELYFRKIDLCDEILVINVEGYVGESTEREIHYAHKLGKKIRWLDPMIPIRFQELRRRGNADESLGGGATRKDEVRSQVLIVRVDFDTMENRIGNAINVTRLGITNRVLAEKLVEKYRCSHKTFKVWGSWDENDRYPKFELVELPEIDADDLEHSCPPHRWSVRQDATPTSCGWAVCLACGGVEVIKPGHGSPSRE